MLEHIRNCVSGWGPLIGILEIVRKNDFILLQKLLWPGWIEIFSVPPWCLPQNMLHLYLSESQSTCSPLSELPGAPGEIGIGCLKSKGAPGLFIIRVFLSFYHMRCSHLFYCLLSYSLAQGNLFSNALPLYSKRIVLSPMVAYLSSGYLPSGTPMLLSEKLCSFLHSLLSLFLVVERFKSNIYQLRRVHSKCTI